MNKIAVVTASIGSLDLYNPTEFLDTVDYHAFVSKDKVGADDNWIRHEGPMFSIDKIFKARRCAKLPKILPQLMLPGYDYYIWIDCTNKLVVNPQVMIEKYLKESDIACFNHPRGCVYKEMDVCIHDNIDHSKNINRFRDLLLKESFPENFGMTENTCRIQRNTPLMLTMGLMWWELICRFSSRDQISFPFVWHKLGFRPTIMPGKAQGENEYMPLWSLGSHKRQI
jgi:hypothetical protein